MGIKMQTYQRMDLRTWGGGRGSWDEVREWHGHIYTTKHKIDSQWEAAAQHREISSVFCDHLEGWDREGGREGDTRGGRYGDICICITDSLCCKAETNTPLQSNYTPIKMFKKKIKGCRHQEHLSTIKGHLKQLTNTIKLSPKDKKKAGTICYFTAYNHQLTKQAIKANTEAATHTQRWGLLPLSGLCM